MLGLNLMSVGAVLHMNGSAAIVDSVDTVDLGSPLFVTLCLVDGHTLGIPGRHLPRGGKIATLP